jgi:AbrB family looped-hinge helix DNA binding protein
MTHKVGPKGQVVIPKPMREALGLEPGDEVVFSLEGAAVRVERKTLPGAVMGSLAGHRLIEALEDDRRRERAR